MSLTTYALTGNVYDAAGSAIEGAVVRVRLVDTDGQPTDDYVTGGGGAAMPQQLTDTTDASGAFSISVFSNLDGVKDTRYLWTVEDPNTGAELGREVIQMPRAASTIDALADSTAVTPTPQTAAAIQVAYAAEWANKAEDSLVSSDAGGDEVDDYSALHHAEKAKEYGEAWATTPEDTLVATSAGGDGSTDYSALHHAAKASARVGYAEEWANADEDTLVSAAAGGNEVDEYSAKHHSAKAATEVTYAAEWASQDEDTLVSVAAGGDGATDYSAKHYAAKADDERGYASEWASADEDTLISTAAGGDGSTDYSAKHWSAKAQGHAADAAADRQTVAADKALVEGFKDDAESARDAAQTAEANVNAIADSDITSALLDYGITNVADVFVYDTSKDDDPDWIHKATWQSWCSEARPSGSWLGAYASVSAAVTDGGVVGDYFWDTTAQLLKEITATGTPAATTIYRGSKAQFPRTAILIAQEGGTQDNLIILDADDPTLPVWMVFDSDTNTYDHMRDAGVTSVSVANGVIGACAGDVKGVFIVDLVRDVTNIITASATTQFAGGVATRNDGVEFVVLDSTETIADNTVNAVALYLDPLAPLDPATNMRRPVIACATDGGVSVIREDGTVVNSSSTNGFDRVVFTGDGTLIYQIASYTIFSASHGTWRSDGFGDVVWGFGSGWLAPSRNANLATDQTRIFGRARLGGNLDFGMFFAPVATRAAKYPVGHLTTAYAVPPTWLPATALALSSTETADLVGATLLDHDFSSDPGYTLDTGWSITGGELVKASGSGNSRAAIFPVSISEGDTVIVEVTTTASGGSVQVGLGENVSEIQSTGVPVPSGAGTTIFQFTADQDYNGAGFRGNDSETISVDSWSVKIGEPDRSGNDAGPIAYGTLTRSAVATGAAITAFDGFSASNYLEHADDHLDPGTGDLSLTFVSRGVNANAAVAEYGQYSGGYSAGGIEIRNVSGVYRVRVTDDGYSTSDSLSGSTPCAGASDPWDVVTIVRRGPFWELWVNGRLDATQAVTNASTSLSGGVMRYGLLLDGTRANGGEMSITTHANYAPTAEQIREQHAILRAWHSENADPTLLSYTVDAIAYDSEWDKLFVAGPDGTTVLHGSTLTRDTTYTSSDANLTSDNHDAVAGGGGIGVIASDAEVRFSLPALALRDKLLSARRVARDGIGVQRAATTDATPTVVAAVFVAEGEVRTYEAIVRAQEAGDPASGHEAAAYKVEWTATRPIDGNVDLLGTPTVTALYEVTSSQDLTIAADTTNELIELTGTGVASTDLVWTTEIRAVGELLGRAS